MKDIGLSALMVDAFSMKALFQRNPFNSRCIDLVLLLPKAWSVSWVPVVPHNPLLPLD